VAGMRRRDAGAALQSADAAGLLEAGRGRGAARERGRRGAAAAEADGDAPAGVETFWLSERGDLAEAARGYTSCCGGWMGGYAKICASRRRRREWAQRLMTGCGEGCEKSKNAEFTVCGLRLGFADGWRG